MISVLCWIYRISFFLEVSRHPSYTVHKLEDIVLNFYTSYFQHLNMFLVCVDNFLMVVLLAP